METDSVDSFIRKLKPILQEEVFEGEVVDAFMVLISEIYQSKQAGKLTKADLGLIQKQAHHALPVHTMHGHAIAKPRVYPGDFELIDKIFTQYCSHAPRWAYWDRHFHSLATFVALRNRKAQFQKLLERGLHSHANSRGPFKVLHVLSGSCRPVKEFLQEHGPDHVQVDCVEVDRHAIEYASGLLGHLGNSVRFFNQNIFRFKPDRTYDLIWAGGLFNYLDDRVFAQMLRHMGAWVNPGGKLTLGVVSSENPNRDYLEVLFDWRVYHRTEKQVMELVTEAGLLDFHAYMYPEATRSIYFLELSKG